MKCQIAEVTEPVLSNSEAFPRNDSLVKTLKPRIKYGVNLFLTTPDSIRGRSSYNSLLMAKVLPPFKREN